MTLRPRLMALSDTTRLAESELVARLTRLAAAARAGSVMIQLRDRQLSDRSRIALGHKLRDGARRHGQLFSVNDRPDLAALLEADALHLTEGSVSAAEARKFADVWLSRACHDPRDAAPRGADAVVLSPILAPRKGRPALGVDALVLARSVVGDRALLYALGGIDEAGVPSCLAAGADGVAVIGAALDSDDPTPLLAALGIAR